MLKSLDIVLNYFIARFFPKPHIKWTAPAHALICCAINNKTFYPVNSSVEASFPLLGGA